MDNSRFLHMHRMWIAASQVKALLWTRLAAESPAFPPCVHRLGHLFAQVIHMLMHRNPVSRLPAGTPGAGVPVPGWSPRGRTRAPGPELDGIGCEAGAGSRLRPLVHGRLRTAPVLTSAVPAAPGGCCGMVRDGPDRHGRHPRDGRPVASVLVKTLLPDKGPDQGPV